MYVLKNVVMGLLVILFFIFTFANNDSARRWNRLCIGTNYYEKNMCNNHGPR